VGGSYQLLTGFQPLPYLGSPHCWWARGPKDPKEVPMTYAAMFIATLIAVPAAIAPVLVGLHRTHRDERTRAVVPVR